LLCYDGCAHRRDLHRNLQALGAGQEKINLDIYPFAMDAAHMQQFATSPNLPFWKTIKPGYDFFEKKHIPATVKVVRKTYSFGN
jgi:murein L,D-transpeptidase YafK